MMDNKKPKLKDVPLYRFHSSFFPQSSFEVLRGQRLTFLILSVLLNGKLFTVSLVEFKIRNGNPIHNQTKHTVRDSVRVIPCQICMIFLDPLENAIFVSYHHNKVQCDAFQPNLDTLAHFRGYIWLWVRSRALWESKLSFLDALASLGSMLESQSLIN